MVDVREGGVRMETPGGWHTDGLTVIEDKAKCKKCTGEM